MNILLIGKQYTAEKERLYNEQHGICSLCNLRLNDDIFSNHLDHDHALDGPNAGRVRALLCANCNSLEGQIKHKFNSSGLRAKGVTIADWLESLVAYHRKDISQNNIHPQYVNDLTKRFSTMTLPEMDQLAEEYGIEFPAKCTKPNRVPIFKKGLKNHLKAKNESHIKTSSL